MIRRKHEKTDQIGLPDSLSCAGSLFAMIRYSGAGSEDARFTLLLVSGRQQKKCIIPDAQGMMHAGINTNRGYGRAKENEPPS